jgi:FlaG/FlaF family flagellin (archaellin)
MRGPDMQKRTGDETAVSGVIGEMLMIGIVLLLVAVFSASLSNYLPSERSPTVTILMSNDTLGNITLWHKGGDWVKADSIRVIVSNQTYQASYRLNDPARFILVPDTQVFDLGGNITVIRGQRLVGDESVVLATDRAVIFSGTVGGGGP